MSAPHQQTSFRETASSPSQVTDRTAETNAFGEQYLEVDINVDAWMKWTKPYTRSDVKRFSAPVYTAMYGSDRGKWSGPSLKQGGSPEVTDRHSQVPTFVFPAASEESYEAGSKHAIADDCDNEEEEDGGVML